MNIVTEPFEPPFRASKQMYLSSQPNYFDQIRMLTTHPFFTGRCPQCKHKLALVARTPGQCNCPACGWSDQENTNS